MFQTKVLENFLAHILRIFPKSVGKIQVSVNSDKNNGYFTWRPLYIFYHISLISS